MMEVLRYPGPVGLQDGNGHPLNCSGEVTFNVTIDGRTTSVSAWVTSDVQKGQLVIGSGTMEDLDLQLQDVHAQDTRIKINPSGSSAITRSSTTGKHTHINQNNTTGEGNLLLPFDLGFHRENVIGGDETKSVYYIIKDGDRFKSLRSKKDVASYLKNHPTGGLTEENFTFKLQHLLLEDPHERYQSVRRANSTRRSTRGRP